MIAVVPALALLLAVQVAPLACPPGAERRGAAPPEGYEEWCEAKDPEGRPWRHGPARTYYDDGGRWTEVSFREGKRDGPFAEYHRGGRKAREGAYARDERDGRWTIWSPTGAVEEESSWRRGVQDGPFAAYWPSGEVRTTGRHCGGAQCGRWRTFDESGRELGSVEYGELRDAP
jgi:antitoxin component YwqK of YwqJK toxin-antitoxin module